jgi:hypothetical protein
MPDDQKDSSLLIFCPFDRAPAEPCWALTKPRKNTGEIAFGVSKCSTIHPQQFPRDTVKSSTSRPRIVQQFKPKTHKNSGKKNRLSAPDLAQNSVSGIF